MSGPGPTRERLFSCYKAPARRFATTGTTGALVLPRQAGGTVEDVAMALQTPRTATVATPIHVWDGARCLAAIITESTPPGRVRVQYFLPPGALTPYPGTAHQHDTAGRAIGGWHHLAECQR